MGAEGSFGEVADDERDEFFFFAMLEFSSWTVPSMSEQAVVSEADCVVTLFCGTSTVCTFPATTSLLVSLLEAAMERRADAPSGSVEGGSLFCALWLLAELEEKAAAAAEAMANPVPEDER